MLSNSFTAHADGCDEYKFDCTIELPDASDTNFKPVRLRSRNDGYRSLIGMRALFSASSTVFGRGRLQQEGNRSDRPPATTDNEPHRPNGMRGAIKSAKMSKFTAAI